jgi:hypothetical protein
MSVSMSPSISNEEAPTEEVKGGGVVFSSTAVFMLVVIAFAVIVAACAGFGEFRYAQRKQRHSPHAESVDVAGFM